MRSQAGGRDGYYTCPAADIEHSRALSNTSVSHQARRRGRRNRFERRKMRPAFSLRLLKFC